jgi:hypothetical protein
MALVTTTVSPTVTDNPFTGLSETVRERSGIARAEVIYSAYGTWPATGAGDNRSISFSFSLDNDYGFVLMESSAAFIASGGNVNMEAAGVMEVTSSLGPGASDIASQWYPYVNHAARQDQNGTTAIGSVVANNYNTLYPITGTNGIMVFNLAPKPTSLLYPYSQRNTIDVTAMFGEDSLQEPILAYRFFCRFLKYDVVQGYNYVVNSPIMTRG